MTVLRIFGSILKICGFAIYGPAHIRNLRICYCGTIPRICGFYLTKKYKKLLVWKLNLFPRFDFAANRFSEVKRGV